jgi:hypothetical protein
MASVPARALPAPALAPDTIPFRDTESPLRLLFRTPFVVPATGAYELQTHLWDSDEPCPHPHGYNPAGRVVVYMFLNLSTGEVIYPSENPVLSRQA